MERGGCVYIITNKNHTVLYTGVTSDLLTRITEHRERKYPKSFACKYNCNKLVYYQFHSRIEEAIGREKQLKAGSRLKKIELISGFNKDWNDLFEELL